MKLPNWATLIGITLGTLAIGLAAKSFLPQRLTTETSYQEDDNTPTPDTSTLPAINVSFLRCGSITIPQCIAVRGIASFAPCLISHSSVLVRHPSATFLYDTGLCTDIHSYLINQSLLFRKTLANFTLEQPLSDHLKRLSIEPSHLNFALLSHLHWDHVSGIPDIPTVPLRINHIEYTAAHQGLLQANSGLVRHLMKDNAIKLFDCTGPAYAGFPSSHDLFGDGSIVLVPLPGHTPGHTGMFINRSNGPRLLLVGDAAWVSQNYIRPATMHPLIWSRVTHDDATARQTLTALHRFSLRHPEIPLIAMHDAKMQATL